MDGKLAGINFLNIVFKKNTDHREKFKKNTNRIGDSDSFAIRQMSSEIEINIYDSYNKMQFDKARSLLA